MHISCAAASVHTMQCRSAIHSTPPTLLLPWPQEAEGLVGELSEVVQQQKLRMRGLAQEKAEACARLQAMNPQVAAAAVPLAMMHLAMNGDWHSLMQVICSGQVNSCGASTQ